MNNAVIDNVARYSRNLIIAYRRQFPKLFVREPPTGTLYPVISSILVCVYWEDGRGWSSKIEDCLDWAMLEDLAKLHVQGCHLSSLWVCFLMPLSLNKRFGTSHSRLWQWGISKDLEIDVGVSLRACRHDEIVASDRLESKQSWPVAFEDYHSFSMFATDLSIVLNVRDVFGGGFGIDLFMHFFIFEDQMTTFISFYKVSFPWQLQ